jgi:tRNA(Arg) A34 adenosine deaminase TadA
VEAVDPDWLPAFLSAARGCSSDDERVRLAIDLARENVARETGGPFGAAVFPHGGAASVAAGTNGVLRLRNSVAHAETVAIMSAQASLRSHSLAGHELFVSAEPCAMCLGAALAAGLERVVFAALREDVEQVGFDEGPVFPESYAYVTKRGLAVVRGLRREEGVAVLQLYAQRGGPIY